MLVKVTQVLPEGRTQPRLINSDLILDIREDEATHHLFIKEEDGFEIEAMESMVWWEANVKE